MEAALNKKQTTTPERIELENCRSANIVTKLLEEVEEPQEVSEEMLNEFNLRVEDSHTKSRLKSRSSSDSDLEEDTGEKGQSLTPQARDKAEDIELDEGDEEEEREGDEDENDKSSEVESFDHSKSNTLTEEDKLALIVSSGKLNSQCETLLQTNMLSTSSCVITPDSSSCSLELKGRDTDTSQVIKSHLLPPTSVTPAVTLETVSFFPSVEELEFCGSFNDISPEHPTKRPVPGSTEQRQKSHTRPPIQAVGGALLLQLKGLKDTPILGQKETDRSAVRAFLRATLSGNVKKKKSSRGRQRPTKESVNQSRFTDYGSSTLSEDSVLETSTLLKRCSLTPRKNLQLELCDVTDKQRVTLKEEENLLPAYVPHALAFKRSYGIQKKSVKSRPLVQDSDGGSSCSTEVVGVLVEPKEPSSLSVKESLFLKTTETEEEDLDAELTRRVQRAARKQAKQEQLKRLHKAQVIQRQLQLVEEKQRLLEARGVAVEKALRGEADYWEESGDSQDFELYLGGLGKLQNPALMQQWFQLVQQKNGLVRYESELMLFARELELEDRQSRLQQELRERMSVDDHLKGASELEEERLILEEMLEVVEQRDALVTLLEEQRLQHSREEQDLEAVILSKGLGLNWD